MTVYVCPSRDIECGSRPQSWCESCPQRSPGPATREGAVYLVATGEVYEGQETYTRNETPPPLCDFERLYLAPPAPTTEPTAKPITGLTEEEIEELWIEHGLDECDPEGFAQIITRALAEKNGLAVQGGES